MTRSAYTVVWDPELQEDFARQWILANSERRAFLTRLGHLIDSTLATAPESVGRPWRQEMIWAPPTLSPKVGIVFKIFSADRIVKISRIIVIEAES